MTNEQFDQLADQCMGHARAIYAHVKGDQAACKTLENEVELLHRAMELDDSAAVELQAKKIESWRLRCEH